MSEKRKIHIGHIIENVFYQSNISITEFAKRIKCTRSNVYSIFERSDIGVEQLIEISKALNHNFLDDVYKGYGLQASTSLLQINIQLNSADLDSTLSKLIEGFENLRK